MSRLSAENPYQPYGGRQSKMRGRRSTGTPSANDSSILSSHPNSTRSSRLSNHSRLSNYSVIHPLSGQQSACPFSINSGNIENNDSLFYKGRTKWSDEPIKSKVGSLDNYYHRPGGGDKDIREIKYHLNAPNSISSMVSSPVYKWHKIWPIKTKGWVKFCILDKGYLFRQKSFMDPDGTMSDCHDLMITMLENISQGSAIWLLVFRTCLICCILAKMKSVPIE